MTHDGYRAGQGRWTGGRIASAAGAAVVQALLAWVLIAGLAVGMPKQIADELKLFAVTPPPPPPRTVPEKPKAASHKQKGKPSPANLRAKPTEIVAPKPIVPVPPPPVVAAP
ncbi:energy transducer TonB, partial [Sphingomonas sp. AR_OL41]|nr:energy transducer TonB [Sphingomonas sp. AR_OL41]